MKRMTRAWLIAPIALFPFVAIGLLLRRILGLSGFAAGGAIAVFVLLGVIASVLVFWYMRGKAKALPEPTTTDDEIDSILLQAKRRLAAARRGAKPGNVPVVLILGPSGSTKTTAVVRSGLEPELLSGEVYRDDTVVPSRVNVWFAEEQIFLEAGGRLLNEPASFARLLRHLRPNRWRALLPGGRQSPRLAIVCYPCDELVKPGAAEAVAGAAQKLRSQLIEASAQLGIRLPVYVLFTKADKLPYFADYVRSFTREEATDVLGATLPVTAAGPSGSWAEREAARVGSALEAIARSLGLRRLELLPRETEEEVRAGLYEFPRELRKAVPFATQFMVDLCRPSQLSVSPFLRGFYFTGVRAVFTEAAQAAGVTAPQAARSSAVEATSVFDPRTVMAAQQRAAQPVAGGRKIPEWAFLRRVLGQLVLRDSVARTITAGGSRLDFARRALLGGAAITLMLLCMAFIVSWRNNGRTINRTADAARALEGVAAAGTVPGLDALQRLDTLRLQLAPLRQWEADGAPLTHRFGLYAGDEVLARVRPLYFERFEQLLWATTRGSLVASLEGLPSQPNEASEYGATYNTLKAYLITTSHPRESTPEFLAPELELQWTRGRSIDSGLLDAAKPQFEFFGSELPFGNPYDDPVNGVLVDSTRAFLRAFGDVDQFYQALVTEASEVAPPVRFPAQAPVSDPVVVPGAYTRGGWVFVQSNLQNVNRLFAREQWVLGDATVAEGDRAGIATQLRERYIADYIRTWQEYLAGARMAGFGGAQGAAANLQILSGRQSPLLRLFVLAAQHTDVDSLVLGKAFQPVYAVMPPSATETLIVEANQPYMQGLLGLQVAMNQVATSPAGPAREGAISNARGATDQLKVQVQQIAQAFNSEGDAQAVGAAVERLLMAPIHNVEGLLTALPSADANAKGQSFCQRFTPLLGKYPFDRRSSIAAQVPEVSAMFQPGSSLLWNFYEENLRQLLLPQGSGYGPALDAPLRPTRAFETFFNRMATISRAFYSADGAGPEVAFELRPEPSAEVSEIRVEFDGQAQVVTPTSRASRTFIWQGANARSARIDVTVNGTPVNVASAQGPWAVFRVFHHAEPNWESLGPGHFRVQWRLPAQNAVLTAEARFDKQIPVFKPDFFERLQCVSRIVAS